MEILIYSCFISILLLVFFKTNAAIEYTKLLKLDFLSKYKDYELKYEEDAALTYIFYLRKYHNCFFVRLITCPICVSIWIGLFISIITHNILILCPIIIFGLLLFLIIDKLLN